MLRNRRCFLIAAVLATAASGDETISDAPLGIKTPIDSSMKRSWSLMAGADLDNPSYSAFLEHPKDLFLTNRMTSDPIADMRQASVAFLESVVGENVPALMSRAMEAFKAPLNIFLSRPPLTFRQGSTLSADSSPPPAATQEEEILELDAPAASIEFEDQQVNIDAPRSYSRPTTFLDEKKSPSQILSELPYYEGSAFDSIWSGDNEGVEPVEQQLEPVEQQEDASTSSWDAAIQTLVREKVLTPDEVEILDAASPPGMVADSRKLNDVVDRLLSIARKIGHGTTIPLSPTPVLIQTPPEVVLVNPPTEPVLPIVPVESPLPLLYSRPFEPYSVSISPRQVSRGLAMPQYPRDFLTYHDPAVDSYLHRAYLPSYNPSQLLLDPIARGRYIYAMNGSKGIDAEDATDAVASETPAVPARPFSRQPPFTVQTLKMSLDEYLDHLTS